MKPNTSVRQLLRVETLLNPDFCLPAGLTLAGLMLSLGTLDRGSYWLNFDTPTQAVEAFDLATGCWDYASGKPGIILTLALIYRLWGASPLWETMVLAGLMAVTLIAVYLLSLQISHSRVVAATAGLAWLGLPAQLYYSRIHVGYPVAWLTVGALALSRKRWWLAGLCFMVSLMGHGTFALPVALFLAVSIITDNGPKTLKAWGQLIGFLLLPWLLYEAMGYAYTGIPFEWTRGTIAWVFFYQRTFQETNWLHVWESIRLTNGTVIAALLGTSVLYPLSRRRNDIGLSVYATAWGMLGLYTLRAGLTHARFIPRAIAGAYPFLTILAVITLAAMTQRASWHLPNGLIKPLYRVAALALSIAFFLELTHNVLVVREFSQSGYPAVETVFRQAAQLDLPVRYWGNQWAALFFAKLYGVQTAIDDPDAKVAASDSQAVLVFEGNNLGMLEQLAPRKSLYEVSRYPHLRTNLWPAGVETELPTPAMASVRRQYQQGAVITPIEIWRPIQREGTFRARTDVGNYIYYYSGGGCVTPPRYGNGTLHWYQVVLNHIRELLQQD